MTAVMVVGVQPVEGVNGVWVEEDGSVHSVANLNPRQVVLIRVGESPREPQFPAHALDAMLTEVEDEFFVEMSSYNEDLTEEAKYVGMLPEFMEFSVEYEDGRGIDELAEQLRALPLRWRLDYIESVRDSLSL